MIHVFLTPTDSKSQILVQTLHKNDPMVEANNIDHAAFHFDFSGRSSVSNGMVCASMNTGRKKSTIATKKSVKR